MGKIQAAQFMIRLILQLPPNSHPSSLLSVRKISSHLIFILPALQLQRHRPLSSRCCQAPSHLSASLIATHASSPSHHHSRHQPCPSHSNLPASQCAPSSCRQPTCPRGQPGNSRRPYGFGRCSSPSWSYSSRRSRRCFVARP